MVELLPIAILALALRILLLGLERIFLKKLELYDSIVVASLFFLIAAFFLLPVFPFLNEPILELFIKSRNALISSLFYSIGFFLYVRALSLEDTSLIAPLYNANLLWVMLFGLLFLGENVTILRVVGGFAIFVSVFFLYGGTLVEKIEAIKASKGSILMIIGSVFLAIGRTIDASTVRSVDPKFYAFAINLFVGLYLFITSILLRRTVDIRNSLKDEPVNLILAGITNGWSYLFLLVALQSIDLSIAEPLSLLSIFVTAFFAKLIFDEKVIQRIPAMIVILIGAFLLFL